MILRTTPVNCIGDSAISTRNSSAKCARVGLIRHSLKTSRCLQPSPGFTLSAKEPKHSLKNEKVGTMTEIARILDQLKRAYEGNAWHGPSVREALEGVTAKQATKRPLSNAHSM